MDPIREQVARAWRRLVWEQFLARAGWCLFAALVVAAVALAVPRLFVIESLPRGWDAWCLLGGVLAGLVAAALWTYFSHRTALDAAIEIDRQFALRERVASSLSLSDEEAASDAGQALMSDALRAVSRIEVGEKIRVRTERSAWLPLVPAVLALVLVAFFDNRQAASIANAAETADVTEQVQRSVESARKKIAERRRQAKLQGLDLDEGLFERIERRTGELAEKNDVDRTEAAIELNDLAKQIEQRQQQLGGEEGLKRQFQTMKQLGAGPADKAAQALQSGDFQSALEETQQLQQQLQNDQLDDEARQQLADQLDKMQQAIDDAVRAHQQAQDDLQQQIERERQQGNLAEAGELQQQLDQLQQQQPMMNMLSQFGVQLGQCQQGLQQGNSGQANDAMAQMSQQLGQMQQQASELEMLQDALDQLQQAKNAMACSHCQGQGCSKCQGGPGGSLAHGNQGPTTPLAGSGDQSSGTPGGGIGTGQGDGLMSGKETTGNAQFRDERVRPKLGSGPGVFAGLVDGPNVKGQAVEALKEEMANLSAEPADPLTIERLPRTRRDHAEDYFHLLRENL